MATKTQAQLVVRVLEKLGASYPGETPSAEDDAYILAEYADILDRLKDQGLAYWAANAIPQEVFGTLTVLVATEVGGAFGAPQPPEARLIAERDLRIHMAKPRSGEPIPADYF